MSLDQNPFYAPEMFPNLVTIRRPSRVRDTKSGGTSQGDPSLVGEHVICSIQQESNDPLPAVTEMGRGVEMRARVYFPIDPETPEFPRLRLEDRITDERDGGSTYIVDRGFDVGGTGEVACARCRYAGP